jgi:DNA-binding PadR family transcriptional regulator
MYLIAIWHLKKSAYGVAIRKILIELSGSHPAFGTIYSTLDHLVNKGYVTSRKGEPTHQRGGHNKIYYSLTEEGKTALMESHKLQKKLWSYLSENPLKER